MNVDKGDGEVVRRFIMSMDIPYPVVTVPEDVVRSYRVTGIPATFLIDRKVRFEKGWSGSVVPSLDS